jgi:hypothetical protein
VRDRFPLRIGHVKPTELGLPGIIGRARHPVPTAHIRHHRACLGLLHNADDLLFRKLLPLHLSFPSSGRTLAPTGGKNGGHVTASILRRVALPRPEDFHSADVG